MTSHARAILESFETLSHEEQREVAAEILRRTLLIDRSPPNDGELLEIANDLFLELEGREAENASLGTSFDSG